MADLIVDPGAGGGRRRYVEVRTGEYAPEVVLAGGSATLALLWTDATLVAASGNVVSGWFDVSARNVLRVGRTATGGAYAFEVDWSRDGDSADFTEALTVANNTTLEKPVGATHARFRVRNTDAVNAFTAHRSNVFAR